MTPSRRPVSFVATSDPEQAKVFYRDVMGLTLLETSPYALVFDDGGALLRVQIVSELSEVSHTAHGWQVTDIDHEIETLASKGVVFLTFEPLAQSPSGIWTSPDGHKIAWFRDPSKNILSLTQYVQQP